MKFKWTGEQDEITIRGTTFQKGKAVDVDDADLSTKIQGIDGFKVVKPRARKKADGNNV